MNVSGGKPDISESVYDGREPRVPYVLCGTEERFNVL